MVQEIRECGVIIREKDLAKRYAHFFAFHVVSFCEGYSGAKAHEREETDSANKSHTQTPTCHFGALE